MYLTTMYTRVDSYSFLLLLCTTSNMVQRKDTYKLRWYYPVFYVLHPLRSTLYFRSIVSAVHALSIIAGKVFHSGQTFTTCYLLCSGIRLLHIPNKERWVILNVYSARKAFIPF